MRFWLARRAEADRHRLEAADEVRRDARRRAGQRYVVESGQQLLEHDPRLEAGQRGAELDLELRRLAQSDRLDERAARAAMARQFPRFPGDHQGVIAEQPRHGLLDHLSETLAPQRPERPWLDRSLLVASER